MSSDQDVPAQARADPAAGSAARTAGELDVERDSDVPISTQIYWQIAYQIDSGRLLPGARLAPVRELGAALRVNPNTIRAVYKRLADAGYVTSRHGAGTHVADRPPQRRGAEALAGIVAEMLRRAAARRVHGRRGRLRHLRRGHRAQATRPARPGPVRRVHERRRRLRRRADRRGVPGHDRGRGHAPRGDPRAARPLPLRPGRDDDVPCRRGPGARRRAACRSSRCSSGPATWTSSTRSRRCRPGSRVGLVCASARGTDNIAETLATVGHDGRRDRVGDDRRRRATRPGRRTADLILLSREALAPGLDERVQPARAHPASGRTSSTRPGWSSSAGRSSTSSADRRRSAPDRLRARG